MSRKRHKQRKPLVGLTANEALEMAEGMSTGEAAQMAIAADIMGLDYDDFIERLASEELKRRKP